MRPLRPGQRFGRHYRGDHGSETIIVEVISVEDTDVVCRQESISGIVWSPDRMARATFDTVFPLEIEPVVQTIEEYRR